MTFGVLVKRILVQRDDGNIAVTIWCLDSRKRGAQRHDTCLDATGVGQRVESDLLITWYRAVDPVFDMEALVRFSSPTMGNSTCENNADQVDGRD
jgi:hypothetical protein